MPAAREDYLIRLIQQVAAALARLRERLTRATTTDATASPQDLDAIGREAGDAIAELLGPQAPLLAQVDATSAVQLLGAPDKVGLWIALLRVQADAARASGDAERAARHASRATALERVALGHDQPL